MRVPTKHAVNNMTNPFEPESHPDVLINLSTGLHRIYEIRSCTLYMLESKGCRVVCMAHLNQVNRAASTSKIRDENIC